MKKLLGAKHILKSILSVALLKKMCGNFNSWILVARHKAIITMLEEIRHKIMDRNIAMR